MLLREGDQRAGQRRGGVRRVQQARLGVQPQIRRDLVVAAAADVDPLAEIAELFRQAALDGQMDVLVFQGNLELARGRGGDDAAQFGDDGLGVGGGQQRRLDRQAGEHGDVRGGAEAIGFHERQIEHAVLPGRVGEHLRVHLPHRRLAAHPSAGSA